MDVIAWCLQHLTIISITTIINITNKQKTSNPGNYSLSALVFELLGHLGVEFML